MTSDRAVKPANFLQNEVMPRRTRAQGSISGVQAESLWAMEPGQEGRWFSIFIHLLQVSPTLLHMGSPW